MLKLWWWTLKALGYTLSLVVIGQFVFRYFGFPYPGFFDYPHFGMYFVCGLMSFVVGLSVGLIFGEENARKPAVDFRSYDL